MKLQSILISLSFILLTISASAQNKHRNNFDSTYAKKHEIAVALGMGMGSGGTYELGKGGTISLEYARVYKFNHFLRTGLRGTIANSRNENQFFLPPSPNHGDNNPDNYSETKGNYITDVSNSYASAFVGYEYGVGRKRFRFTFGADLFVGLHSRKVFNKEETFLQTRSLDPVTDLYNYNIQFLSDGSIMGTSSNIFMALSPRLGIRRELGRRVALALTFNPQIGFSQRVKYTENLEGTRPTAYNNPKSAWFITHNAELRLIFKLGKNAPKFNSPGTPSF